MHAAAVASIIPKMRTIRSHPCTRAETIDELILASLPDRVITTPSSTGVGLDLTRNLSLLLGTRLCQVMEALNHTV
jgi:hypothetical protein